MLKEVLYKNIANSSAHRKVRDDNACYVLENHLADDLITLALNVKDKNHFKACWTLELVLEENLDLLAPHLTAFCEALPKFTHDGALRSVAKICMFCALRLKTKSDFLTKKQIDQITEICFSWLISEEKVATKAYAIRSLFETGKRLDWVYEALVPILHVGFLNHSAAYKAVARQVLGKINP